MKTAAGSDSRATGTAGLLAAALTLASCGGGGGSFTAATPPSDVCSLLTTADIMTLQPTSTVGVEQQTPDTSSLGFWSRDCKWSPTSGGTDVELVIFGATTAQGLASVKLAASSGSVNMPVSGLGTEAHYWQDTTNNTGGLWAIDGSQSVDITAYFFPAFPPESQFHPLVAKVLGEIK